MMHIRICCQPDTYTSNTGICIIQCLSNTESAVRLYIILTMITFHVKADRTRFYSRRMSISTSDAADCLKKCFDC